jgi:hypothetical protein
MFRLSISVSVDDIDRSIAFYQALFQATPLEATAHGARWELDDPELDFAISRRTGGEPVLSRLGMHMASMADLEALRLRLAAAGPGEAAETSDSIAEPHAWTVDPSGLIWEAPIAGHGQMTGPTSAAYVTALLNREAAQRKSTFVQHRTHVRRRGEIVFKRPEGRM